jgi:hypothetical protein
MRPDLIKIETTDKHLPLKAFLLTCPAILRCGTVESGAEAGFIL